MGSWKDQFPKENRYFETDSGILYLGDCLEIMKEFPKKSIKLILTDPPYPDYYTKDFKYNIVQVGVFKDFSCRQFIFWSAKVEFPLDYTARHVWDKITGAANQYDFIYERNGYRRQKVFRGHRINSTVSARFAKEVFWGHKAQKPINVIQDILEYSGVENGVVFDPFLGSGTTAVACERLNRRWIGIEIEEKYCEIAKERIQREGRRFGLLKLKRRRK